GFRRGADRYLSGSLLLALHTSARQRADELRAATLGNRLARVSSLAPRRSAGRLREEFGGTALHRRQGVLDNVHPRSKRRSAMVWMSRSRTPTSRRCCIRSNGLGAYIGGSRSGLATMADNADHPRNPHPRR